MSDPKASVVGVGNMVRVTRHLLDAAIGQGMIDADFTRIYERFDEMPGAVGKDPS